MIIRVALGEPAAAGVKVTVMVQVLPPAIEGRQVFVSAKSAASVPDRAILDTGR